jgi:hypothetical protein
VPRSAARDAAIDDARIESELLRMLAQRDPESSCCPSDIARSLAPSDEAAWRGLMPRIRAAAARLASSQRVIVTRGSRTLQPEEYAGGPVRIRRGTKF